jgi:predicted transcriptional regulator
MKNVITIRLDDELDKMLNQVSRKLKQSRSEVVRDSLRRQLSIHLFEALRKNTLPFAEKKGYLTDDDILNEIS